MQTNKYEKAELYLLRAVEIFLELKHPFSFQALENLVRSFFLLVLFRAIRQWDSLAAKEGRVVSDKQREARLRGTTERNASVFLSDCIFSNIETICGT
jgi:hypothetical protein